MALVKRKLKRINITRDGLTESGTGILNLVENLYTTCLRESNAHHGKGNVIKILICHMFIFLYLNKYMKKIH